jgi:hypothetical protein
VKGAARVQGTSNRPCAAKGPDAYDLPRATGRARAVSDAHCHLARRRRHTAGARTRPRAFGPRKGGAGPGAGQARPGGGPRATAGTSPTGAERVRCAARGSARRCRAPGRSAGRPVSDRNRHRPLHHTPGQRLGFQPQLRLHPIHGSSKTLLPPAGLRRTPSRPSSATSPSPRPDPDPRHRRADPRFRLCRLTAKTARTHAPISAPGGTTVGNIGDARMCSNAGKPAFAGPAPSTANRAATSCGQARPRQQGGASGAAMPRPGRTGSAKGGATRSRRCTGNGQQHGSPDQNRKVTDRHESPLSRPAFLTC